jgi:hypothetical protein
MLSDDFPCPPLRNLPDKALAVSVAQQHVGLTATTCITPSSTPGRTTTKTETYKKIRNGLNCGFNFIAFIRFSPDIGLLAVLYARPFRFGSKQIEKVNYNLHYC